MKRGRDYVSCTSSNLFSDMQVKLSRCFLLRDCLGCPLCVIVLFLFCVREYAHVIVMFKINHKENNSVDIACGAVNYKHYLHSNFSLFLTL